MERSLEGRLRKTGGGPLLAESPRTLPACDSSAAVDSWSSSMGGHLIVIPAEMLDAAAPVTGSDQHERRASGLVRAGKLAAAYLADKRPTVTGSLWGLPSHGLPHQARLCGRDGHASLSREPALCSSSAMKSTKVRMRADIWWRWG